LRRSRLVGALGVGEWPDVSRVQQAVRDRVIVWPWQTLRFTRTGRLYPQTKLQSVHQWPAAATVCNCTGLTRGQLGDAIAAGAGSIDALMRNTGASTVCGSCRPLLQELLGGNAVHAPVFGSRTIAVGSLAAAALALVAIFLPAWPYSASVEAGIGIDQFWASGTWKQVSGYSLVTLSAVIAFLSIRKRVRLDWLGSYRWWRLVHVVLGTAALAMLFMHTGFNLGNNLNRWLMVTFLALAVAGSIAGAATAREHAALAKGKPSRRSATTWMHILALWPLPLLLTLHVLTVYAY
jgi:nitrite reductase (NADH) large subunit